MTKALNLPDAHSQDVPAVKIPLISPPRVRENEVFQFHILSQDQFTWFREGKQSILWQKIPLIQGL